MGEMAQDTRTLVERQPGLLVDPQVAPDSPLEGTGFEPSVPRERRVPSFSRYEGFDHRDAWSAGRVSSLQRVT